MAASVTAPSRVLGRYALYDVIAAGGMATVHFGRLIGPVGFARTVAIKRLHPQFARDPEFVSMFLDEARLAARIRHPNVVPTLDVVALEGELFLVMEYVQGEPLGALLKSLRRQNKTMPPGYAVAVVVGALRGLHAAHEAVDERGAPLGIVHRDVSPQNILVGVDGVPRVLDFGVAKAVGRIQTTREGQLKGKMAYMAPEQIRSLGTDRRTDIYAAGAVLWEALTGRRLFQADNDVAVFSKVLEGKIELPSKVAPGVPPALDAIVLKALSMSPHDRFDTAREMARVLEVTVPLVSTSEIGEWVEAAGHEQLITRAQTVTRIEADTSTTLDASGDQAPRSLSSRSLVDIPVQQRLSVSNVSEVSPDPNTGGAGERTEVSDASAMHSAVTATRFRPKRVAAVAGGVLVLVAAVASLIRLVSPHPSEGDESSAAPATSASAARVDRAEGTLVTAPAPVAPATVGLAASSEPSVAREPLAPPATPTTASEPVAPATAVATAPPASAPVPTPPPSLVATATAPPAVVPVAAPAPNTPQHQRSGQPARSHQLDTVLDSRK